MTQAALGWGQKSCLQYSRLGHVDNDISGCATIQVSVDAPN